MIITRSPLRVSLGGGGTDLPSYYREFGGFLVAAAIDKYVYLTQHRTFQPGIIVKYSKLERADHVDQIEHPIVREALKARPGLYTQMGNQRACTTGRMQAVELLKSGRFGRPVEAHIWTGGMSRGMYFVDPWSPVTPAQAVPGTLKRQDRQRSAPQAR